MVPITPTHTGLGVNGGAAGAAGGGMYMGRAIDPNPGPVWSAGHRGLCAYVARLLAPVYDKRVAVEAGGGSKAAGGRGGGAVVGCRLTPATLEVWRSASRWCVVWRLRRCLHAHPENAVYTRT